MCMLLHHKIREPIMFQHADEENTTLVNQEIGLFPNLQIHLKSF